MGHLALVTILISIIILLDLSFAGEDILVSNDLEKSLGSLKLEAIDSKNLTEIISKNNKNIQLIKITDPEVIEELNNIVKNQDAHGYSESDSGILLCDLVQRFESVNDAKAQFLPAIPAAFYYGAIAGGALVVIIYNTINPVESKSTNIYHNETINMIGNNTTVSTGDHINTSDSPVIDISYQPEYMPNLSVSNLSAQVFSPSI